MAIDDLGDAVPLAGPAHRVCSLVPSLTEAIAATTPERLVGVTDWCTHPTDLDALGVTRVRGTKNPDVAKIVALRPDLVVANQEENRLLDVTRLREAGIPVWVTRIESIDEALTSLGRLLAEGLGVRRPEWLERASAVWAAPPRLPTRRVVVPIWKNPWMVIGAPTFTADLLARLGLALVPLGEGRYPRVELGDIIAAGPDLVVLPDEPYAFGPTDGPADLDGLPSACVPGRWLTWYGPSMVEARGALEALLT